MAAIQAQYSDGRSARQQQVQVHLLEDGQLMLNERIYPITEINISDRLGSTPRYLQLPDGGHLETDDNTAIDGWLKANKQQRGNRLIAALEQHYLAVISCVLAVIVLSAATYRYGLPYAAQQVADALPDWAYQQLGEQTLALLDKSALAPSKLSAETQAQWQQSFEQFRNKLPASLADKLRLHFRFSPMGANALALPNGDIVVTDGFVRLLANDEEFWSVLAHEAGHIEYQHGMRNTVQSSLLLFIISAVFGDAGSVATELAAAPAFLLEMQYSRHFEIEADDFALDFMQQHELEPDAFARILGKMIGGKGKPAEPTEHEHGTTLNHLAEYLSTHPDPQGRIQRFQKASE